MRRKSNKTISQIEKEGFEVSFDKEGSQNGYIKATVTHNTTKMSESSSDTINALTNANMAYKKLNHMLEIYYKNQLNPVK